MDKIHDDDIKILYAIIRQSEDAEACYDQKEAIRQIKRLAHLGNHDAVIALDHLSKAPGLHPFLREIMFA
jgi:DNA-directed RNA polymerase subunit F